MSLARKAPFDDLDRFFEKFVAVGIDFGTTYGISNCQKTLYIVTDIFDLIGTQGFVGLGQLTLRI